MEKISLQTKSSRKHYCCVVIVAFPADKRQLLMMKSYSMQALRDDLKMTRCPLILLPLQISPPFSQFLSGCSGETRRSYGCRVHVYNGIRELMVLFEAFSSARTDEQITSKLKRSGKVRNMILQQIFHKSLTNNIVVNGGAGLGRTYLII